MAKKKIRRRYSAYVYLQTGELTKAGTALWLDVYAEDRKIGQLVIGRGSIGWKKGKKQIEKWLRWDEFAKVVDQRFH